MNASMATITRVVMLIISLANTACAALGIVPTEIVGDSQAYLIGSLIINALISLICMWYNNSFTAEAILADKYLSALIGAMTDAVDRDENASET